MVLPNVRPIIPIIPPENWTIPNLRDPTWSLELKFDGFRGLLHIEGTASYFISRSRTVLVGKFQRLAESIQDELRVSYAILDGEIIVLDPSTMYSNPSLLRNKSNVPIFAAFDLLWLGTENLTSLPLHERKRRLEKLTRHTKHVRYVPSMYGRDASELLSNVKKGSLEGVVLKKTTDIYTTSTRWYKILNTNYRRPKKP